MSRLGDNLDFGDGGSFPELHISQFPLGMGKGNSTTKGNQLALTTDSAGNTQYDGISKQNQRGGKVVHTGYESLVEKAPQAMPKPSAEERAKLAEATALALRGISDVKIKAAYTQGKPKQHDATPQFIRYHPSNSSAGHNSGQATRVIRMVEAQVDPMQPPSFKHKKAPPGPGSPPVPVQRSPQRKITQEEQKKWTVPPCVSNWKNVQGYVISMDKRLAADGRNLHESQVSDGFARLSNALYVAERTVRHEVGARETLAKQQALKKKKKYEEVLGEMAQRVRQDRLRETTGQAGPSNQEAEAADDLEAKRKRDQIRQERAREFQKEQNLAERGGRTARKDSERDISERIALGQAAPSFDKGSMYDARLFNQAGEGLSSGFAESSANPYTKPLFNSAAQASMAYRPKKAAVEAEMNRGQLVDKALAFETADKGDDPFGVDGILDSKKRRKE